MVAAVCLARTGPAGRANAQRKGLFVKRTILLIAAVSLILIAAGCDSSSGQSSSTSGGGATYTADQYEQLSTGMTIDDVDGIMGGGAATSESEFNGQTMQIYMYVNSDGSNVTVSFVDGKLNSKTKAGF